MVRELRFAVLFAIALPGRRRSRRLPSDEGGQGALCRCEQLHGVEAGGGVLGQADARPGRILLSSAAPFLRPSQARHCSSGAARVGLTGWVISPVCRLSSRRPSRSFRQRARRDQE